METIRQIYNKLMANRRKLIDEGNIALANEITANLTVGSMILMMIVLLILSWILNEVGLFTVDNASMRYVVIATIVMEIPILVTLKKYNGEPKWMKYLLEYGLILMCANMSAILGHNVVLVTIIPMIFSTRYYNEKFSANVAFMCIIAFTAATVVSAYEGIINLNVLHLPEGTTITIEDNLRDSLTANGIDRNDYLKDLLINDFIPRFLIFSVVAVSCVRIALRGRQTIDLQVESSLKSGRIATELDLATKIQNSMLPCIFPAFPAHKQLDLYAKNIPAKEVGGDFYDYFMIDDDHAALVMADVSGKGVGAALFMTISKIVLKNQLQSGISVSEAVMNTNEQLCENNEAGLFVTAWIGILEISTGKLTFTNAGHNPPILRKKGCKCEYIQSRNGMVLAAFEMSRYTESVIYLSTGDELFLYTDGVTEATDVNNELYGEERLIKALDSISDLSVHEQIDDIFSQLNDFAGEAEQFDDITMMCMKIIENNNK